MMEPIFFRLGSIYIITQDVFSLPQNVNISINNNRFKNVIWFEKSEIAINDFHNGNNNDQNNKNNKYWNIIKLQT